MEERKENAMRLAVVVVMQALMERDKSLTPMIKKFIRRVGGDLRWSSSLVKVLEDLAYELREETGGGRKVG